MRWAGLRRPWPVYIVEVDENELRAIREALEAYEDEDRRQTCARLVADISVILERGKKS